MDQAGKAHKGAVDGENERAARSKLRRQGIYVTKIKEQALSSKQNQTFVQSLGGRIPQQDLVTMTRQLATLVRASIPVIDSLTALVDQVSNAKLKMILMDVRRQVNEGASLADGMNKYPKVFSRIYVSMVRVGEASGTLEGVLTRLAQFADRDFKLRQKIRGAMTYPVIMVTISLLVMTLLLTFVVPRITAIFKDMKKKLPWFTELLISVSDFVRSYWWFIGGMAVGGFLLARWYTNTEKGKKRFDRILLRIPVIGQLSLYMAISRFSQTLSTLLGGGIPLLDGMEIVKTVVDNDVLRTALEKASEEITEGKSIAKPLEKSEVFPPMVTHMISIGERTGELEPMLNIITESFETEVDTKISSLTTLLEPAMMVIMGIIVFMIVFAIVTPLMEMSNIQT
jgi:general secretion pathway protein F